MGLSLSDTDQRQTISNLGKVKKNKRFSLKELSKISYYSILIDYRKNDLETKILLNLKKKVFWDSGFKLIGS